MGSKPPINVALSLIRSCAYSVLTYGIEAIHLSPSDVRNFSFAYNSAFCKLFKSNDHNVIAQCQFFCRVWPFYALYDYLRFSFLFSQFNNNFVSECNLFYHLDYTDMIVIANKYGFQMNDSYSTFKAKIWRFIECSLA